MVVVIVSLGFLLTYLVERITRDVVKVEEGNASLSHYLTIPFAIGVISALYLALRPLIARSEGDEDRSGTLLTNILDELLQIPSERIYHLILLVLLHLIDVAGVLGTRNGATHLLVGQRTDVVMPKLDEHMSPG